MTRKLSDKSKGMIFTSGMLAGLIFLLFVPRDVTGQLQLTYARVFHWPLSMGRSLTRVSQTTTSMQDVSPKDHEAVLMANQQLRNESANLQAQLQEANKQIEQFTKLRARPGWERMRLVPASIATPASQGIDELIINAGQEEGVAVGQYVMSFTGTSPTDECIIGTVSSVWSRGARVKLITSKASRIPIRIANLNVPRSIMTGLGDGTALIPLVPEKYTIRKGDVVYAEKNQGFLDVPVIAAEVVAYKRNADQATVWDITVRPVCDVASLSDVVVISPATAQ